MKSSEIFLERKAIIVFFSVLLIGFLAMMRPFIMPTLLAAILTTVFFPLYDKARFFLKGRARLAAIVTTVVVFLIIILPVTWMVTILMNQLYGLVGQLDFKEIFGKLFSTDFYLTSIEPRIQDLEVRFQVKISLFDVFTNFAKQTARYIYSYSPAVLLGTAQFIFNFFIMLIGIYFLFLEGPALLKLFYDLSPLRETHERRLSLRVRETINASVFGYLVTGFIQGLLAAGIFAMVDLNVFALLGATTFFMSMVPVVGASGVWIPVCVWLFLHGQTGQGIVVLVGGAGIISGIDNFLKPILIQGKTRIHPLLIFFSLFGGIKLFGPLGILFGPVITALLIAIIQIYREEFVQP